VAEGLRLAARAPVSLRKLASMAASARASAGVR
jgi:hypothetical protein